MSGKSLTPSIALISPKSFFVWKKQHGRNKPLNEFMITLTFQLFPWTHLIYHRTGRLVVKFYHFIVNKITEHAIEL